MTSGIGHADALAAAAWLRSVLPHELRRFFDASFIRSHLLYEEFVYRLVLRVVRDTGLDAMMREPGSAREIATRARLESGQALVPLDWMLRYLAARGSLEELAGEGCCRYRSGGPLPALDPALVREYPAFLRGEVVGEEVLFSARRLRLWIDYFSNDNGLYAVNNRVGAAAVERWLPRAGGVLLELGGGLGSGALALLERLETAGRLGALAEYRFTEFVPAFLRRGEQTLRARHPALTCFTFGLLDMNRAFVEQGVAPGTVSVVFAVNTLHVAHDLD